MSVRDELTNATIGPVARAAFRCIDVLQDERKGSQLAGAAVLFLLICRRNNLDPREVLSLSSGMLNAAFRDNNEHALAIKMFLKEDVASDSFAYF